MIPPVSRSIHIAALAVGLALVAGSCGDEASDLAHVRVTVNGLDNAVQFTVRHYHSADADLSVGVQFLDSGGGSLGVVTNLVYSAVDDQFFGEAPVPLVPDAGASLQVFALDPAIGLATLHTVPYPINP